MSRYKASESRNQLMLPFSLDDLIPENAEVRALDAIIDRLNIHSLDFTHSETKSTGRKPYDPADMFRLYAYSYYNGIRSSRKIERECNRNIELMWLIGGLRPDFKTIADFRRNNKAAIGDAFKRFGLICAELGLIGKEIVAVDGSKFRASNSRMAYHSQAKIEKKLEHHAKVAEQYMTLLDCVDSAETTSVSWTRDELLAKIDRVNERIVELNMLHEEVKQSGTRYDTDADARMMKTNNHGADICHNVQIAVDDKNHLVVAVDVTSQPVDKEQLYNISSQAKENMQVGTMTVIADKGYYSAKQFELCELAQIEPIVTCANQSHHVGNIEYAKERFRYDESSGCYICPANESLTPMHLKSGYVKYANMTACRQCVQKTACTSGKYRTIQDKPLEMYARIVDERTRKHADTYKQRKQLVEHPWGTVKRAWGFSYFLTRGTENVRTESVLHFLVYNLKRAINTMGSQELIAALLG